MPTPQYHLACREAALSFANHILWEEHDIDGYRAALTIARNAWRNYIASLPPVNPAN